MTLFVCDLPAKAKEYTAEPCGVYHSAVPYETLRPNKGGQKLMKTQRVLGRVEWLPRVQPAVADCPAP